MGKIRLGVNIDHVATVRNGGDTFLSFKSGSIRAKKGLTL